MYRQTYQILPSLELSGHTLTGSSFRIIGEEQARERFSVLNVVESSLLEVI